MLLADDTSRFDAGPCSLLYRSGKSRHPLGIERERCITLPQLNGYFVHLGDKSVACHCRPGQLVMRAGHVCQRLGDMCRIRIHLCVNLVPLLNEIRFSGERPAFLLRGSGLLRYGC